MEIKSYNELFNSLEDNKNLIYSYGIIEEATGHFIYTIHNKIKRPVLVVLQNDKRARNLYNSLENLNIDVLFYPELEENYQLIENFDFKNRTDRMKTIISLLNNEAKIIITTIEALSKKIAKKENLLDKKIQININNEINLEELIESLNKLGYQRRNIIEAKGEFAVRGDIVDIFQIHEENPTRLELFDIEIDSIRKFDIYTQMSIDNIDSFSIYPNSENILDANDIKDIIKKIKNDIEFSKNNIDEENIERLDQKFSRLIEELEYNQKVDNIDLLIPYLKDNDDSLFDYYPKDGIIIFEDLSNIENKYIEKEKVRKYSIQERIDNGDLLKSHHNIFFDFVELMNKAIDFQKINTSLILKNVKHFDIEKLVEFKIRQTQAYHGRFEEFIDDMKYNIDNEYKTFILVPDRENANKLINQLKEFKIDSEITELENREIKKVVNILIFDIDQGFEYYEDKISFISYSQIFKKAKKIKSRTRKNKEIINYSDLEYGDLLVHDSYGIAKYVGIKNIELNNIKSDFIELHYSGGDKLFVPVSDMSMVSKFVGQGDKKPKLSNLNSSEWKKTRSKVKKEIEKIAEDLVKLYAKRLEVEGFQFSKDTPWQTEFEDSFIFTETNSQLQAIDEIKADMESTKVMDRLLCGDVGYGKTEVALRAAFKAIMDGKQAVMLAPTTILVNQHFNTIKSRFENFPIKIDFLSRFKTPAQRKKTIEELKDGSIDFVVGTHSLVSKDIEFKNLGILIIDEEQRFGVRDKEKIKKLSENIDVLTLSATPIPRTLQMSLSGIRDMSLLDEHPENRLPINTYVMDYDPIYIREAILKELSRGGQIYFVYNRVNSIHRMYDRIKELVPESRIAISHGRMSTRELENVIEDFTDKKYDILLTTTIIETGMDIQNVNTMIVYNADMMGLSQLYQLKGRIGRSSRSSFAYFTYAKNKVITEVAEKRLKAIKDFDELGSGYKIAMRDLELRGAGNLLGESQSGHIESIGYDLYVRMLQETVDEIKGIKPRKIGKTVKIDLNIDVYIPSDYIQDENEKINIYKKISYIENSDEHSSIIDELIDRFGDIPKPVQNIIDISYIRAMLIDNDFESIIGREDYIEIAYADIDIFDFKKLQILSKEFNSKIKFDLIDNPKIYIENKKGYIFEIIRLLEIVTKINKGEFDEKQN